MNVEIVKVLNENSYYLYLYDVLTCYFLSADTAGMIAAATAGLLFIGLVVGYFRRAIRALQQRGQGDNCLTRVLYLWFLV